jgi:hypothetical protein
LNVAPVGDAGPDQSATYGATVQLNGANSSDVNGDPLTFSWSFVSRPPGSLATLSSATSPTPTFDADAVGEYVVGLVVNDGRVNSTPDTVIITTSNTTPCGQRWTGPDRRHRRCGISGWQPVERRGRQSPDVLLEPAVEAGFQHRHAG